MHSFSPAPAGAGMSAWTTQIGGYGIVRVSAAGKTVAAVLEPGRLTKHMQKCGFRVTCKNYKRNSRKVQLFDDSRIFMHQPAQKTA
jgi:hypothetical protein